MQGQVSVIAGVDGAVFVQWHEFGEELVKLDDLRNSWRSDATIQEVLPMRSRYMEGITSKLKSRWMGGYLYRRDVLDRLHKLLAKETYS